MSVISRHMYKYSFSDSDTRPVKGVHPVGERFQCFFSAKKALQSLCMDVSPKTSYGMHKHNLDFDLAPLYKPMHILKKNPFHCFLLTE